ncbi:rhamnose utilization protein RhaD (predicted bifunctional aldolase and dehydrogenase) [Aminobacter niigataensis]|uniref:Rhamnose utilization protein RhaD (Predicted bifunctional aldolase and dehydrogenase) n=1 Tax=Aminobacter niigataensis TaxID=83265 RepID=A0ABR6L6E3_9HYPH|nr:class II aldolase/adducin family protein [Aminobacter niigataensis]MBB4652354.1 rhamnose utilization protein RhaD (predicted bifunctional aldolase and dehydrogenase) [Aminobacter niigataensis]
MPESAGWQAELEELKAVSARIGSDPLLTQGAGGNTSLKVGGTLWIKASGTWLAHALERDIMVPVEMAPLIAAVEAIDPAAEQAHQFTIAPLNRSGLRPSIETTVHALMPQRVVLHVHCVDTIAHAVRSDCIEQVGPRLAGLNWAYVPYARPGLPLALAIAEHRTQRPDVLVLANHGLVVAAETVAKAEALLDDVKARLRIVPRAASGPRLDRLVQLAAGTGYRLPQSEVAHSVATDPVSTALAAKGSLYPDHVIFLGVGSAIAKDGEDVAAVIARVSASPVSILFPGEGILMRDDATPGADAMARCLADVLARVQEAAPVRVLTLEEHLQLTDWDAEKYRQDLARRAATKKTA